MGGLKNDIRELDRLAAAMEGRAPRRRRRPSYEERTRPGGLRPPLSPDEALAGLDAEERTGGSWIYTGESPVTRIKVGQHEATMGRVPFGKDKFGQERTYAGYWAWEVRTPLKVNGDMLSRQNGVRYADSEEQARAGIRQQMARNEEYLMRHPADRYHPPPFTPFR